MTSRKVEGIVVLIGFIMWLSIAGEHTIAWIAWGMVPEMKGLSLVGLELSAALLFASLGIRWLGQSSIGLLRARLGAAERTRVQTTSILRLETCTCGSRPDPTDVPLDNVPGHHDFSCRFREVMQPVLVALARPTGEAQPCSKCGQVDVGQQGEYPCSVCGLPVLWGQRIPRRGPPLAREETAHD